MFIAFLVWLYKLAVRMMFAFSPIVLRWRRLLVRWRRLLGFREHSYVITIGATK